MRFTGTIALAVLMVAAMALASWTPAEAAPRNNNRNNNNNNNNNANNAAEQARQQAIATANTALQGAKLKQQQAESKLITVASKLRGTTTEPAEVSAAKADLKSAQEQYDDARRTAIKTIATQPAYMAVVKEHERSQAGLKAAKAAQDAARTNDPTGTSVASEAATKSVSDAAAADMKADTAQRKLENDACDHDQACIDAKKKVDDAMAAVRAATAKSTAVLADNPEWQAAKSDLDQARAATAQAQKDYEAALAKR